MARGAGGGTEKRKRGARRGGELRGNSERVGGLGGAAGVPQPPTGPPGSARARGEGQPAAGLERAKRSAQGGPRGRFTAARSRFRQGPRGWVVRVAKTVVEYFCP